MDEILHLKRQIKMLTITCSALVICVFGLFLVAARNSLYGDSWPNATLGELKVKKISVVGDDGQPKIRMETKDGGPMIAVMNGESGPNMFIGDADGQLSLLFEHGPNVRSMMNSDGIVLENSGKTQLTVHDGNDTPFIQMKEPDSEKTIVIGEGLIQLGDESKKMVRIASITPAIQVQDENGYSANMGRAFVRSGKDGTTTITTAATIVGTSKTNAVTWSLLRAGSPQ